MKLVLHVGMAKSGSTALQRGLRAMRDRLLGHGYLYPPGHRVRHNHSFLVAAIEPPERLPRFYLPHYGSRPEQVAPDLEAWIAAIRRQVGRHRPKTLLMSAEGLFVRTGPEQLAALAALLRSLADEIEIVAYLRRPSEFYLSSMQQILHADHRIRPVEPIAYRRHLEGFASIANRLWVFRYDRADFPGGDVLRHFLQAACPDVGGEDLPRLEANVSLSAEAIAILAEYHRHHHRSRRGQFLADASLLREALGDADRTLVPNRRTSLHADVTRALDEGSVDLLWLRDAHGIRFDGIDYDRIAPPLSLAPRRPKRLQEVVAIDARRKARVTLHTFRYLADKAVPLQDATEPMDAAGAGGPPAPLRKAGRKRVRRRAQGQASASPLRSALRRLLGRRLP